MFWSNRNVVFKSEKYGNLLFAGNTGSFYKVGDDLFLKLQHMQENVNIDLPEEVLAQFKKNGVILEYDDLFLLNMLRLKALYQQSSHDYISLTIAPTLDCNFRCEYCYEKSNVDTSKSQKIMSDEIIDKIIELCKDYKKAYIYWYGGEPLLAFDKIKYMTTQLKQFGVNTAYSLVTNGYLLSLDVINYLLDECIIESIQITLDGLKDNHNMRRPHISDSDSYSVIMKNLEYLYNKLKLTNNNTTRISIRMNIDKHNQDDYVTLNKEIRLKTNDRFSVYSAFVFAAKNCTDIGTCILNQKEQKNFLVSLYKDEGLHEREMAFPDPGLFYCGAQRLNNMVIDPSGNIYRCWEDIGSNENRIANILDNKMQNEKADAQYLIRSHPFNIENCIKCPLLYLCKGDCPKRRLDKLAQGSTDFCPLIKKNIFEFLEYHYETLIVNKDMENRIDDNE